MGWKASAMPVNSTFCGLALAECCTRYNSTSGSFMQEQDCTCVEEGQDPMLFESVLPGERNLYHWRVQDFQGLDDADGERRRISFDVEVCQGSAHIYVKALDQPPVPSADDHHFSATEHYGPNSIAVLALRGQFYVSVVGADDDEDIVAAAETIPSLNYTAPTASSSSSNTTSSSSNGVTTIPSLQMPTELAGYGARQPRTVYHMRVHFDDDGEYGRPSRPALGNEGNLTVTNLFTEQLVLDDGTLSMYVDLTTPLAPGYPPANSTDSATTDYPVLEYRVVVARNATPTDEEMQEAEEALAAGDVQAAALATDGALHCGSGAHPGACVTSSPCGVMMSMVPRGDWVALPSDGGEHTLIADGLLQDEPYRFAVIVRDPSLPASQRDDPLRMSVYTATEGTPEYFKEEKLHSNSTIYIILGSVAGVLLLALVGVLVCRWRLASTMREKQAERALITSEEVKDLRNKARERQSRRSLGGKSKGSRGSGESRSRSASGEEPGRALSQPVTAQPAPQVAGASQAPML